MRVPFDRARFGRWLGNLAVGLGNAPFSDAIMHALREKLPQVPEMVQEHIQWALQQQAGKRDRIPS